MTEVTKVRLRFAKCGDLRLVSHRDIMRCLERMLRRARIPIALTQGFNPRPKMTFALALGLGIEGRSEVVDLELFEPLEPSELLFRLKSVAPAGFDWIDARPLPTDATPPHAQDGRVQHSRFSMSAVRRRSPTCSRSWPVKAGPSRGAGPIASRPSTCVPNWSRPS